MDTFDIPENSVIEQIEEPPRLPSLTKDLLDELPKKRGPKGKNKGGNLARKKEVARENLQKARAVKKGQAEEKRNVN
jgi:hypothetical protein